MPQAIDEITTGYVDALRRLAPILREWWSAHLKTEDEDSLWHRWPTGLAGHPRFLFVFRKYYFLIEELNQSELDSRNQDDFRPSEEHWGTESMEFGPGFERHIDRLVLDIKHVAPDVADIVDGLCFVPVGTDSLENPV